MHHHFASKFLIDSLHSHGFCSSYSTVLQYERSAAATQGTDISGYKSDQFIQYVADNVDHNTRTLDGTGTFHGMGIIATITPGTRTTRLAPKKAVTTEDISAAGRIDIRHYKGPSEDIPRLLYRAYELKGAGYVSKPRSSLEADSTDASSPTAWMVGHDTNGLWRLLPWPVNNHVPSDD